MAFKRIKNIREGISPRGGVILHGPSEELTGQIPVVSDAALPLFEEAE